MRISALRHKFPHRESLGRYRALRQESKAPRDLARGQGADRAAIQLYLATDRLQDPRQRLQQR